VIVRIRGVWPVRYWHLRDGIQKGDVYTGRRIVEKAGVAEIGCHLATIFDASQQFMLYSPRICLIQEIRLGEDIVALLGIVIRCNSYGSRRILGRTVPDASSAVAGPLANTF
jgi:hypothetical protein